MSQWEKLWIVFEIKDLLDSDWTKELGQNPKTPTLCPLRGSPLRAFTDTAVLLEMEGVDLTIHF